MNQADKLRSFLAIDPENMLFNKRRIRLACGVTRQTVNNWISGKVPIRRAFQLTINDEFRRNIFDL